MLCIRASPYGCARHCAACLPHVLSFAIARLPLFFNCHNCTGCARCFHRFDGFAAPYVPRAGAAFLKYVAAVIDIHRRIRRCALQRRPGSPAPDSETWNQSCDRPDYNSAAGALTHAREPGADSKGARTCCQPGARLLTHRIIARKVRARLNTDDVCARLAYNRHSLRAAGHLTVGATMGPLTVWCDRV